MVSFGEEILLTLGAKNNASSIFNQVDKDAQSMASNISSAISSINQGLMNIGAVSDNVMQGLTGKSAMDNIFGTSSKAETNKVLLNNMTETKKGAEELYNTVDKVTDSSLTSMQELIPAMKAFKSATGASDKEMIGITDEMANFGAAVLAQTGSTAMAEQSMMDLSKGIKGAFASLDQYGITQESLQRTGYWNGDEKDVEGFMKAVEKVTGSTEELMETNQGLDALIGKAFSRAGKKIGNEFLPVIKDIKKGFLDLDNSLGGNLTASILAVSGGVEVLNQGLWNVSTTVNGIRDLKDGFVALKEVIKGTTEAAESASDAINTISNVSDIGAGMGIAKNAGKSEKTVEAGMGAISAADMLKGNNKEYEKLKKEIEKTVSERNKILEQLNSGDELNEIKSKYLKEKVDSKVLDKWSVANDNDVQKLADLQLNKEKRYKDLQRQLSKSDMKISKDLEKVRDFDIFKNRGKNQELSSEAISGLFGLQDNTLKNFEKENWGLSDAIKDSFKNQKTKISDALTSGKDMLTSIPGKFKGSFKSISSSITDSISSFGDTLANIKTDGIKGNFKKLDQKLLDVFKGTDEISDALNVVDDVGDVSKELKGVDNIVEGVESVAGAGSAMAAAAPEMEAAAAGSAAVEAGATTLSATFTSLMVPLLAVFAAIMIMIPIVSVIAAEAMIFIRLLADFMESLNFDSINLDGAIKGISQIATALGWVGVAMAAMSFTSIMTGLAVITSGFLGITGPLDIAVNAIKEADEKLSQFNSLNINPSVATNIAAISDSLLAISNAMGALTWTNINTGFSNFIAGALGFSSVTDGLDQAKNDIMEASQKLQEFSTLTPLDSTVVTNIQNVCDSLASVGNAMSALRDIRDSQNWDAMIGDFLSGIFGEGVDIQTALLNVKDDIIQASTALAQFTGISEIPEDIGTKIQKVGSTLTTVNDTITTIKDMVGSGFDNWVDGLFGGYDVAGGLDQIKTDLITASQKLAELSAMSEVSEDVTTKITNVGNALTALNQVIPTLTSLPPMEDFNIESVSMAVQNVRDVATQLSTLSSVTLGEEAGGILGTINTALQSLKDTLANAGGFTEVSVSIGSQIISGVQSGIAPLGGAVQSSVSSAIGSASGAASSGGANLGTQVNMGFQSTLNLHSVMEAEMGYVKSAVDSGISAAKSAAQSGAAEIVQAFQSGINVGSPGDIAKTMKQEMIYTNGFILGAYGDLKKSAYDAGRLIVDSFGNPKLNIDNGNSSLKYIGALDTIMSKAPTSQDNKTIIMYNNVTVDARNKTEKEAKSIMTLALEGMDNITDIDVDV